MNNYLFEKIGDCSGEFAQIIATTCLLFSKNFCGWIFIYAIGILINFFVNKKLQNIGNKRMPSGHFQSIFYSLSFVFCVFYITEKNLFNKFWTFPTFLFFICIFSCANNCIEYKYHSPIQIFAGALVGTAIGCLTFSSAFLFNN